MFDQLFTCRRTVQRYIAAPLTDQRVRYLHHCAAQGAARRTLRTVAAYQLAVIRTMNVRPAGEIHSAEIHAAAERWAARTPPYHSRKTAVGGRRVFTATATRWLRFLGRLRVPRQAAHPCAGMVAEFVDYMRIGQGLAPSTVYTRGKRIEEFVGRVCAAGRDVHDLTLEDLDAAIAQKGTQDGCARASIRTYAYTLRAFVRYAERRRWCTPGLGSGGCWCRASTRGSTCRPGPRGTRCNACARDAQGDTAAQIRDRALLLLFAVYGLRVSEVRRLRLDDVNWHAEVICVTRSKQRPRIQHYPLCQSVGDALLRYLRIRPHPCAHREIFLSLKAPIRPLGNSALWQIVNRRLRPFGPAAPPSGSPCIAPWVRHTPAPARPVPLADRGVSRTSDAGRHAGLREGRPHGAPARRRGQSGGTRMTIRETIDRYVALRQAAGADFRATASVLSTFCRAVGEAVEVADIPVAHVRAFVNGTGPLTRYWHRKAFRAAWFLSLRGRAPPGRGDAVAIHRAEAAAVDRAVHLHA